MEIFIKLVVFALVIWIVIALIKGVVRLFRGISRKVKTMGAGVTEQMTSALEGAESKVKFIPEYAKSKSQLIPEHAEPMSQFKPEHPESKSQFKPEHPESKSQFKPEHPESKSHFKPEHEESEDQSVQNNNNDGVIGLLVLVSIAVAVFAYGAMVSLGDLNNLSANYSSFDTSRFIWSALIGTAYPIVGAIMVKLCALLRQGAYLGKIDPWPRNRIIWLVIIWPLTLIFSLFVYPCLLFIHLLF